LGANLTHDLAVFSTLQVRQRVMFVLLFLVLELLHLFLNLCIREGVDLLYRRPNGSLYLLRTAVRILERTACHCVNRGLAELLPILQRVFLGGFLRFHNPRTVETRFYT
jgi:hypothetical protein